MALCCRDSFGLGNDHKFYIGHTSNKKKILCSNSDILSLLKLQIPASLSLSITALSGTWPLMHWQPGLKRTQHNKVLCEHKAGFSQVRCWPCSSEWDSEDVSSKRIFSVINSMISTPHIELEVTMELRFAYMTVELPEEKQHFLHMSNIKYAKWLLKTRIKLGM